MASVYIRSPRYAEVIFERIYTLAAFRGLRPFDPFTSDCMALISWHALEIQITVLLRERKNGKQATRVGPPGRE